MQLESLDSVERIRQVYKETTDYATGLATQLRIRYYNVISPMFKHVMTETHGKESRDWTVIPPSAWDAIFDPPAQPDEDSDFEMEAQPSTDEKVLLMCAVL